MRKGKGKAASVGRGGSEDGDFLVFLMILLYILSKIFNVPFIPEKINALHEKLTFLTIWLKESKIFSL